MKAAQVRLENVGKRYGDQWVLRQVHLQIERGEFYTFLGPSGCGKTTLLRSIAGFISPDEGTVYLDAAPVNHVPPWQRDVGMVFQNYALWPHMTVYENVAFGLRERKVSKVEMERRVTQALEKVDLKGTEWRRPSQLSGGQQQRVALARTLIIQPRVLLLDEPLSNLDAKLRAEMRLELLKLQRELGITTIYVTHDQEEALALSTRIAVMESGRIVQEGSPPEIYEEPRDRFVAEFVGKSNLFCGTIVHLTDTFLEIQTDDGLQIRAASPIASRKLRQGEKVLLNVRPEAVHLKRPGEALSEINQLSGKVSALAYQGSSVEYEIEVSGRALKAYIVNPKGGTLFQRGEEVRVVFAPENVSFVHGEFRKER